MVALRARQDDEIATGSGSPGGTKTQPHAGLQPQRIEIVEIGDMRQQRNGDDRPRRS